MRTSESEAATAVTETTTTTTKAAAAATNYPFGLSEFANESIDEEFEDSTDLPREPDPALVPVPDNDEEADDYDEEMDESGPHSAIMDLI